jgi:hypothetical protein
MDREKCRYHLYLSMITPNINFFEFIWMGNTIKEAIDFAKTWNPADGNEYSWRLLDNTTNEWL